MNLKIIVAITILCLYQSAFKCTNIKTENHVLSIGQDMDLICPSIHDQNPDETISDVTWNMDGESRPLQVVRQHNQVIFRIQYAYYPEIGCYTCYRKSSILRRVCIDVIEYLDFSETTSDAIIAVPKSQGQIDLSCSSKKNASAIQIIWFWNSILASTQQVLPVNLNEYFEGNAKVSCTLVTGNLTATRIFELHRLSKPPTPIIRDATKSGSTLTVHWLSPFFDGFNRIEKFFAICQNGNETFYNETIAAPRTDIRLPPEHSFSCKFYSSNEDFYSDPVTVDETLVSSNGSGATIEVLNLTSTTINILIRPESGLMKFLSGVIYFEEPHVLCYSSLRGVQKLILITSQSEVYELSDLQSNQQYKMILKKGTTCRDNNTAIASALAYTKPKNFPKPDNIEIRALSSDVVVISWRSMAPINDEVHHYHIWYCGSSKIQCKTIKGGMNIAAGQESRTVRIEDLEPRTKYFVSVKERASTFEDFSVFSDILEFSTKDSTYLPRNLTFLKTPSHFIFSWLPPINDQGEIINSTEYKIVWYCFTGGHSKILRLTEYDLMNPNISMTLNNSELCSKFYFTVCALQPGKVCTFAVAEVDNPVHISILGWILILMAFIVPFLFLLHSFIVDRALTDEQRRKLENNDVEGCTLKKSFDGIGAMFIRQFENLKDKMKRTNGKTDSAPTYIANSQLSELKVMIENDKNCDKVNSNFCWCYSEILDNMSLWDFAKLKEEYMTIPPINDVLHYEYSDSVLMPCDGKYFQGTNGQMDYGIIKHPNQYNFNKFWLMVHYRKIKLVVIIPSIANYSGDMFEKMIEPDNMSIQVELTESYERKYNTFCVFTVSQKFEPAYASMEPNRVMLVIPKISKLTEEILYLYMYEVMYQVHYTFHRQSEQFFTVFIDENVKYSAILMVVDIVLRKSLVTDHLNIPSILYNLRYRYPILINRFNDYCTIYEVANEFICLPEYDLPNESVLESRNAFLEFIQLNLISHGSHSEASENQNDDYNKSDMYLPYNFNRVKLSSEFYVEKHNYVNASIISMPHTTKEIIIAHAPYSEVTLERFWDMVWTTEAAMVINMVPSEIMSGSIDKYPIYDYACGKFCKIFYPFNHIKRELDGQSTVLQYAASRKPPSKHSKCELRTVRITWKLEVREIQYITVEGSNDIDLVDRIAEVVNHYRQFQSNHPVVIMCSNGSELSPTVAATAFASIQSSQAGFFNIGHIVRCIKRQRKNALMSKNNWSIAFEAAQIARTTSLPRKMDNYLKSPNKCHAIADGTLV